MTKAPKKAAVAAPVIRAPSDREVAAIAKAQARKEARPVRPTMLVEKQEGGTLHLGPAHSDSHGAADLLKDTLGTGSADFAYRALVQISASCHGKEAGVSQEAMNAQLALIGAVAPENELEAALALQMAATHDLSLHLIERAKHATTIDHMKEYGNLATKASRTFTTQMKALSDLRRGGEQVVRHVHVYQGGQAVVAETLNLGAQNANSLGQCHALSATMLGPHPAGDGLPISSGEGPEALPNARRQEPRRAKR